LVSAPSIDNASNRDGYETERLPFICQIPSLGHADATAPTRLSTRVVVVPKSLLWKPSLEASAVCGVCGVASDVIDVARDLISGIRHADEFPERYKMKDVRAR
jgi:hypothetical protein